MTNKIADKLYFDARYIRVDHHDGISRFSAGLFAAVSQKIATIAIISDMRQLESLPKDSEYVLLNDPTKFFAELNIARKLNKLGAKLVFSPMQTMGTSGRKFKLLLTLHDLIYYAHPAAPPSMPPLIRVGWRIFHSTYWPQRLLLNAADAVVTVSETTKRLIHMHSLTKRSVHVVYNAAAHVHEQHKAAHTRPTSPQKLVYMGSFMDYKNVETLASAMHLLPEYELHLLSKIDNSRREQLAALAPQERIVFHNGVTEGEYLNLLDQAVALVSASKDEGFGIPVIEAMGRGCPAVISNMPIFREIGGEAAIYFENESSESFAKAIASIESSAAWKSASKASLAQAKKFNWQASADELLAAIETLY